MPLQLLISFFVHQINVLLLFLIMDQIQIVKLFFQFLLFLNLFLLYEFQQQDLNFLVNLNLV